MTQLPPPRRRGAAPFRPRFTVMLAWLAFFYLLYGLLLALPEMFTLLRQARTLTDQEALAQGKAATRAAMQGGRVYLALAAAAVTVGLGAWQKALPGLR